MAKIIIRDSRGKQITEISWDEIISTLVYKVSLLFSPSNQYVVPTKRVKDNIWISGESGRVRFEVSKLRDPETRNAFKLELHNRFEGLQQMEEEEPSVDDKWRQIEQGYVETCEKVLGQAKSKKK